MVTGVGLQQLLLVAIETLFVFGVVVVALAPLVSRLRISRGVLAPDRSSASRTKVGGSDTFAPLLGLVPVLMAVAVIPYGGAYLVGDRFVSLVVADIDWGLLYVFVLMTLGAYAPVLAGWTGNGASSLRVGLESAAQMISYTAALGLSVAGIFMLFGSLKLTDIASAQDSSFRLFVFVEILELGTLPAWLEWVRLPNWGIFLQPVGFVLAFTCLLGANQRPPLDSPQADFGLNALAELVQTVVIAALVTTLFLGSWTIPYLPQNTIIAALASQSSSGLATALCMGLHAASFLAKVVAVIWLQLWIQGLLPRLRYDQVMDLCWKRILPLSLANLFVTALAMLWLGDVT